MEHEKMNHCYKLHLVLHPSNKDHIRNIQKARHRIRKIITTGNVSVWLSLGITLYDDCYGCLCSPNITDADKNAILELLDDFPCRELSLANFTVDDDNDEFVHYTGIQEIITKAIISQNCQTLRLSDKFSDSAFQFVYHLITANVGTGRIQQLSLSYLVLSNKSWALLASNNSPIIGNGKENSKLKICPEMSDDTLSQIIVQGNVLSGFRQLCLVVHQFYLETFQSLGQLLSSSNCKLSRLELRIGWSEDYVERPDFLNRLLETITTNNSLVDLSISNILSTTLKPTELTSLGRNVHKFHQLQRLMVTIPLDPLPCLEFLRPMLNHSISTSTCRHSTGSSWNDLHPPLSRLNTLDIQCSKGWTDTNGNLLFNNNNNNNNNDSVETISETDDTLLWMLAQQYPHLSSFGSRLGTSPSVQYALAMNGWWRQCFTQDPQLPLSLWQVVLAAVDTKHQSDKRNGNKVKTKDVIIASVRYEMIKYLVPNHFAGFQSLLLTGSV